MPTEPIPREVEDYLDKMNHHLCGRHTHGDDLHDGFGDENDVVDNNIGVNNPRRRQNRNEFRPWKTRQLWDWDEVESGKFVYFKYYGLWHAGLVTDKFPDRNVVLIVHFALPGLLSTRVVREEEITVDLDNDELWEVYVPPNQRVSAAEAVERARARIGQRNFNMFFNRSSHMVKACVVRE